MSAKNNIPPQIQELLKKRGWSWPPDEQLKMQIHEALEQFCGSIHVPEENLNAVFEGIRGFEYVRRAKKLS